MTPDEANNLGDALKTAEKLQELLAAHDKEREELRHDRGEGFVPRDPFGAWETIRQIAHDCSCGLFDVIETSPRLPDGTPFPTLYYLTDPRLTAEAFRRDGFGPDPAFSCLIAEGEVDPPVRAARPAAVVQDDREVQGQFFVRAPQLTHPPQGLSPAQQTLWQFDLDRQRLYDEESYKLLQLGEQLPLLLGTLPQQLEAAVCRSGVLVSSDRAVEATPSELRFAFRHRITIRCVIFQNIDCANNDTVRLTQMLGPDEIEIFAKRRPGDRIMDVALARELELLHVRRERPHRPALAHHFEGHALADLALAARLCPPRSGRHPLDARRRRAPAPRACAAGR